MNKWLKRTLIAGAAAAAAGAVLLGAGMALGGSPSFYYDADGLHVKENTKEPARKDYVLESTRTGKLSELEVELKDADLEIVSGTDWTVEYSLDGGRTEPFYSLENGVLILREGDYADRGEVQVSLGFGDGWMRQAEETARSPYVKITIPENAALSRVKLQNRYGKISVAKSLRADIVGIDGNGGDIRLDGWTGEKLTVETGDGNLAAGTLKGEDVSITGEYASLSIDSLNAELAVLETEYGNLTAGVDGGTVEAYSSDGEVDLKLDGSLEDFGVSLHTEYGTIRIPQGAVEPDEEEESTDFVRLGRGQDAAAVTVETEYGDIRIREK